MIEIAFDPAFERAFRKRIRNQKILENFFWKKVEQFIKNPFHPQLKTHKLSGKLKNLLSFSVDYDCRVISYFKSENKVVFLGIGTHNEIY